jgi:hypothetical protein
MQKQAWFGAIAAIAAVIAAAGCGSGSTSSGSGEEGKTADQIFSDALSALDAQQVVHISQTSTDSTGTFKEDALVTGDAGRASITDPSGATTLLVLAGGAAYGSQGGSPFQQLTGDLLTQVSSITIHQTARCARTEHGTLTKGSISTVNGKRVIAIVDDGKAPGATPGSVDVALDGPPLPLHIEQTGAATPGGSLSCGHTSQSTTMSVKIDLDYPSGSVTITAPPVGA